MPLSAWAADFEEKVKTVKGCPPVIDAMTHGFLLTLACDLQVDRGRFEWNWDALPSELQPHVTRSPIHFHMAEAGEGSQLYRPGWISVKFSHPQEVEHRDGWWNLHTPPHNRLHTPQHYPPPHVTR